MKEKKNQPINSFKDIFRKIDDMFDFKLKMLDRNMWLAYYIIIIYIITIIGFTVLISNNILFNNPLIYAVSGIIISSFITYTLNDYWLCEKIKIKRKLFKEIKEGIQNKRKISNKLYENYPDELIIEFIHEELKDLLKLDKEKIEFLITNKPSKNAKS